MKYNYPKTLGVQASRLVLGLYERGKKTFSLAEASEVTGLKGQLLQNLLQGLVKKGVLTHLSTGLYNIVPLELGHTKEYFGNPYVIAREIVRKTHKTDDTRYCISHGSAFDLHQMTTQPQLVIYTTVVKRIKSHPSILGTEFRFVTSNPKHFFGVKKVWIDKTEMVFVSDLEKTIVDGLKMPEYCGGITEVAKGLWMKRDDIDCYLIVNYAEKMNIGAVYRRLGYLMEVYKIGNIQLLDRLQQKISKTYMLLDPTLLQEGKHFARWRLRLNIREEELKAVIRT